MNRCNRKKGTDNPLYTDTRYNDKIRNNDDTTVTNRRWRGNI